MSFPDAPHEVVPVPLSGNIETLLHDYERVILSKVLSHHDGNKSEAARALHISERVTRYKIQRLGIDVSRSDP